MAKLRMSVKRCLKCGWWFLEFPATIRDGAETEVQFASNDVCRSCLELEGSPFPLEEISGPVPRVYRKRQPRHVQTTKAKNPRYIQ